MVKNDHGHGPVGHCQLGNFLMDMVKCILTMENSDFGHGYGQNFRPFVFDNLNIFAMVMVRKF